MSNFHMPVMAFAGCLLATTAAYAQQIHYVDDDAPVFGNGSSWSLAYKDLQDALAVAAPGDEIWVAEGHYTPAPPGSSRTSTFTLPDEVGVYGGFAGDELSKDDRHGDASVLSGDLDADDGLGIKSDNSYRVVTGSNTSAAARLDRFTITAGQADASGQDKGAGMYVYPGSPTVVDCVFLGNVAANTSTSSTGRVGAGLYVRQGDPLIQGCRFEDNNSNHIGGGAGVHLGSATFRDCVFAGNVAGGTNKSGGAGLLVLSSDVKLVDCLFEANSTVPPAYGGGAAIFVLHGTVRAQNVRFLGNVITDGEGGAVAVEGELQASEFTNCLFSGNASSSDGGALAVVDDAAPSLFNCTLVGNAAPAGLGGGVFIEAGSSLHVRNTIVWDNSDSLGSDELAQIHRAGGLDLKWSTVMDWTGPSGPLGGSEVLVADPLFVDPDGADLVVGTLDDDLRLSAGSPCVDAGNDGDVPADSCDLDDDGVLLEFVPFDLDLAARFVGDVDHGSYERGDSVCGAPWTNLGLGLAGALGTPVLTGTGSLVGGTPTALDLTGAQPFVPYYFILGLTQLSAPFKGGTLVPSPDIVSALPPIFPGAVSLAFTWPTGVPSCTDIWFQYWIQDPTGPVGFTASNGLRATTP